jgi:protein-disulfide isomerase
MIYENQDLLQPDILLSWAEELGLDLKAFGTAISQGDITKRIKDDRASGIRSGVNGTPSFFINGTRYDEDPDSLLDALEEELTVL